MNVTFRLPAQQRLEHLPERLFGCVGRVDGTPAHETVRSHDHHGEDGHILAGSAIHR
jgi:hypothetical protein